MKLLEIDYNLDTFKFLEDYLANTRFFYRPDHTTISWSTQFINDTDLLNQFFKIVQSILPTTPYGLKLKPLTYAYMIRLVAFSKVKGKEALVNKILFESVRSGNKMNAMIVNALIAWKRITKNYNDAKTFWERMLSLNVIRPSIVTLNEMLLLCLDCKASMSEVDAYVDEFKKRKIISRGILANVEHTTRKLIAFNQDQNQQLEEIKSWEKLNSEDDEKLAQEQLIRDQEQLIRDQEQLLIEKERRKIARERKSRYNDNFDETEPVIGRKSSRTKSANSLRE
jgi:signal transduction histidine kinase